jgi:hypothetical protein
MGLWSAITAIFGLEPVKFVRRYSQRRPTQEGTATYFYEVYRAKTAQEAREFLDQKPFPKPLHYLIVETPQGNWGKDINGMYREN